MQIGNKVYEINQDNLEKTEAIISKWLDHYEKINPNGDDSPSNKRPNFTKALKIANFTLGHLTLQITSELMKQELVLADMNGKLAILKEEALRNVKMNVKYDLDSKGVDTCIQAEANYNKQNVQISKQEALVKYLKNVFETVKFYPKNVNDLIAIEKYVNSGV